MRYWFKSKFGAVRSLDGCTACRVRGAFLGAAELSARTEARAAGAGCCAAGFRARPQLHLGASHRREHRNTWEHHDHHDEPV